MSAIVIRDMIEYASEVPRIASWFFNEWRSLYGSETSASVQRRIESWLTRDRIPTALVAVHEGRIIGTVALKEQEIEKVSWTPWLAGVFVLPEFRKRGVGALLVQAAEKKAALIGVQRLYLYTPDGKTYYRRLGWSVVEHCLLPSGPVAVMSKELQPDPSIQNGRPAADFKR